MGVSVSIPKEGDALLPQAFVGTWTTPKSIVMDGYAPNVVDLIISNTGRVETAIHVSSTTKIRFSSSSSLTSEKYSRMVVTGCTQSDSGPTILTCAGMEMTICFLFGTTNKATYQITAMDANDFEMTPEEEQLLRNSLSLSDSDPLPPMIKLMEMLPDGTLSGIIQQDVPLVLMRINEAPTTLKVERLFKEKLVINKEGSNGRSISHVKLNNLEAQAKTIGEYAMGLDNQL